MAQLLMGTAILFIIANLYYFFTNKTYRKSYISTALFVNLFVVFIGVMVGFSGIYYALSINNTILVVDLSSREPITPTFMDLLYFSGETLLSVGYGDMVPVGIARFISLIESLIGILLPTAYFIRALSGRRDR